ncbi:MAG: hypothetical protein P1U47_13590 [Zhongshania sp.]|uniref:hypothetical protein n=1 Tax=Zhongshania sp. TaxID=1971902 RepID=UPI0026326164|nr:hypothetical protein [Zhongshania sp.]MDF1693408.1 hypothetical protein [Zhongshania sp.]
MKHRLVFLSKTPAQLREIADMLDQPHLSGWRWRVVSKHIADVQRLGVPVASALLLSNLWGRAWRGGFWGLMLGCLLVLIFTSAFGLEDGLARSILNFSLPISFLCFGAWEGGFVGLTEDNPDLCAFQSYVDDGRLVLLVDVHDIDQRLVKKIMGMCNAEQIADYSRLLPGFPWRQRDLAGAHSGEH